VAQPTTVTISHRLGKVEAKAHRRRFDQIKGQLGAISLTHFSQLWDGDR